MKHARLLLCSVLCLAWPVAPARPQANAGVDLVLQAILREGMERSQVIPLARALLDSIGPRLTGTPAERAAHEWAASRYRGWGIEARSEQFGTWIEWRRGTTHVDLLEPRVRTLAGALLAWSPGTRGPVQGEVVALPELAGAAEFEEWLRGVRGKWVLAAEPQSSCRPNESQTRWAAPRTAELDGEERAGAGGDWSRRMAATGLDYRWLPMRLEQAGVAGVLTTRWSGGWGTRQLLNAWTLRAPMLDLDCEDYGLLFRLAGNGRPMLRVDAGAEFGGDVPLFNTLAVIRGVEKPDEYVLLSAHLDSWDGASGATDNGSGTVVVMEAMRLLRQAYPRPRRTILVGHWSGEEQGLNGSLAFAADHPEVVRGLQAVFNQDQGTGRTRIVSMQGLTGAEAHFRRWLSRVPPQLGVRVELVTPGTADASGSDHASFVCRGAPAFNLESVEWDYRTYTWHTDRDTFDKLVPDDLRHNAVLTAMLAYLASEDPDRVPRERTAGPLPVCRKPARSMVEFFESLAQ